MQNIKAATCIIQPGANLLRLNYLSGGSLEILFVKSQEPFTEQLESWC